jgi:hypothetical protein
MGALQAFCVRGLQGLAVYRLERSSGIGYARTTATRRIKTRRLLSITSFTVMLS